MLYKKTLQDITARLLDPDTNFAGLHKAVGDLYELFQSVSKQNLEVSRHRESMETAGGKAIGPLWAAMCIRDTLRTKSFLRGLYMAILQMQEKKRGAHPIHVLYAGTGPFAALALPLITFFRPEQVQFTFLEINPLSVRSLQKTIEVFEAQSFVRILLQCDAASFLPPETFPTFDILISETMLPALRDEPQVAITLNLAPQMAPDGILIPQNISVQAGLLHPAKNMKRMLDLEEVITDHFILLGSVMEWNRTQALAQQKPDIFPVTAIEIPRDLSADYRQLCLFTKIQVFEEETLDYWQSHLTQPLIVLDQVKNMRKFTFQYETGTNPGFIWKVAGGGTE